MNSQITTQLQHALEQYRLPGLAVSITHRGENMFAGGQGCFDAAGLRNITDQTQFGVASLSKLVTTMLILLLQERGDLSLDDLVTRFYPSLRVAQHAPMKLAHLLSHSAGLPGLPGRFYARNLDDPNDRSGGIGPRDNDSAKSPSDEMPERPTILTAGELAALLNELDFDLLAAPGELLNYSNEGFCLLGGVIEQITQRPYAELVHEMIFAPLQMDRSVVGVPSSRPSDEVALPLLREGAGYRTASFWRTPLFYPAGGCISSARDIARLIGALAETAPLLNPASKQHMMRRHVSVASRPDPGIGYALGLEFQQIDSDTTMLWHSGQRAGVSSFMGWLVEEQLAVSVLCNVADAPVTSIAHELIGAVLNRTDVSWPPAVLTNGISNNNPESLVGCYASAEGNRFFVEQHEDQLLLTGPSMTSAQQFQFSGPGNAKAGTVGPQTFRFLSATPQSKPWALALDLRVFRRAG